MDEFDFEAFEDFETPDFSSEVPTMDEDYGPMIDDVSAESDSAGGFVTEADLEKNDVHAAIGAGSVGHTSSSFWDQAATLGRAGVTSIPGVSSLFGIKKVGNPVSGAVPIYKKPAVILTGVITLLLVGYMATKR